MITKNEVEHPKPDPDLFLVAADRLGADIHSSVVVGDSVLDPLAARRADTLGVGLLLAAMAKMNSNAQTPTVSIKISMISGAPRRARRASPK